VLDVSCLMGECVCVLDMLHFMGECVVWVSVFFKYVVFVG